MPDIANMAARFLAKTPLQRLDAILERIPFRPLEVGLYYSLRKVGAPGNPSRDSDLVIRPGLEADLDLLTRAMPKADRFLRRFQDGDRCLLAMEAGQVVGYLWFSVREVYDEELTGYRVRIPGNAVYSYDEYVSPALRRRGILTRLFAVLHDWMDGHGKDTILILISDDNPDSWHAHLKRGFVPLTGILYVRFLGLRLYRVRSVSDSQAEELRGRWL
jgi:GNAT superfamily N-acetyltransferase